MADDRRRAWQRLLGVRGRTTLVATVVVALALTAAGIAAVEVQRRDLTSNVEDATRLRAQDVASLLEEGALPSTLAVRRADEALIQIVDAEGVVVAASANVSSLPPLVAAAPAAGDEVIERVPSLEPVDDDPFVMVARGVDGPGGVHTVIVGATLEGVGDSAASLRAALFLAVPPLVLVVALTTWIVTGRALRPVERIRADVAAIGASDLGRRVEEPRIEDEIGRLARTMNAMLARLEAAQVRQDRFVADASHELKSPIAAIRAQIEVEAAQGASGERAVALRSALEELDRMESLVLDLLAVQQALERVDDRVPIDLDDLVLAEVERVRPRSEVAFDLSGVSGARVVGSRRLLLRAVANLIENARQHAGSVVTIELAERDGQALLAIVDDGPGIPADEAERVFERFERLDPARARRVGGTGLGLAIARETVEGDGGRIYIDPAHEAGTRVVIELPLASTRDAAG